MTTVTVRGEGTAPVTPDTLDLVLSLVAEEDAPDAALDAVTARDAELRLALDELGIPLQARVTTVASVSERYEFDERDRRQPAGYRATISVLVTLSDVGLAGRVMKAASARAHAHVQGPGWRIGAEHPARLEACRAAVRDARRRAEAYAEEFGYRVTALTSATETAADPGGYGYALAARKPVHMAEDLVVSPGEQTVRATIEATFELEPLG
jgi:uncharacterized protein